MCKKPKDYHLKLTITLVNYIKNERLMRNNVIPKSIPRVSSENTDGAKRIQTMASLFSIDRPFVFKNMIRSWHANSWTPCVLADKMKCLKAKFRIGRKGLGKESGRL